MLNKSSQDSIYREREPETADRGSDGDDANETCAAGAGLMSRNSLKTSAVGASSRGRFVAVSRRRGPFIVYVAASRPSLGRVWWP